MVVNNDAMPVEVSTVISTDPIYGHGGVNNIRV